MICPGGYRLDAFLLHLFRNRLAFRRRLVPGFVRLYTWLFPLLTYWMYCKYKTDFKVSKARQGANLLVIYGNYENNYFSEICMARKVEERKGWNIARIKILERRTREIMRELKISNLLNREELPALKIKHQLPTQIEKENNTISIIHTHTHTHTHTRAH